MLDPKLKVPIVQTVVSAGGLIAALKTVLAPSEQSAARVIAAQKCHESGAKKLPNGDFALVSAVNWNMSGVKALGWTGTWHAVTTTERLKRGDVNKRIALGNCEIVADSGGDMVTLRFHPPAPECNFRAYATLDDSIADYFKLIRKRYQSALDEASKGEPDLFVKALKAKGYFTGDLAAYQKSVRWYWKQLETFDGEPVEVLIQKELVRCGEQIAIDGRIGLQSKKAILTCLKKLNA